ncbi:SH3 domain-containing protein [Prevotella sp. kh1p2]|nr:SH3 domain-containing protein [Prevotella sp. kh1p2]
MKKTCMLLLASVLGGVGVALPYELQAKTGPDFAVAGRYLAVGDCLHEREQEGVSSAKSDFPEWIRDMTADSRTVTVDADFSGILSAKDDPFIGFIGSDYQKLKIDFIKVQRKGSNQYDVTGTSTVRQNLSHFHGTIQILDNREFIHPMYGVDDTMEGKFKRRGCSVGKYRFEENRNEAGSGVFSGYLLFFWYQTPQDTIVYDDIFADADGYCNNQYAGTWQSYTTKQSKKCAWGQYRIPESGDLDVGAAEFSVNPKYLHHGWDERERTETEILRDFMRKNGYKEPSYQEFRNKCLFLFGVSLNESPEDYARSILPHVEYSLNEPARLMFTNAEGLFYQPEVSGAPTEAAARRMLATKENGLGDQLVAYNKLLFNDDDAALAYFGNHPDEAIEVVYNLDYEGKPALTKKAIAFAHQTDVYTGFTEDILFYHNKSRGFRKNFIADIYQYCCTDKKKTEDFEYLIYSYIGAYKQLDYKPEVKDECLVYLISCLMDYDRKHDEEVFDLRYAKSYQFVSNVLTSNPDIAKRLKAKNYYNNKQLEELMNIVAASHEDEADTYDANMVWYHIVDPDGYCNLREKGSPSAKIIKRIASDSPVDVINSKGDWWKVKTSDGTTGYVHKSRIKKY